MRELGRDLLDQGFKGELRTGEPLSHHCSLKVGGPVDLFAVASDIKDLVIAIRSLEKRSMPWMVLGGGTNTLFANGGFSGCVVKLGSGFSGVVLEEDAALFAGGSALLQTLVTRTGDEGLAGLECLAGIPGTVGGAVRMNAGSGSGDISGALEEAHVYSGGRICWLQRSELGFAYRHSEIHEGDVVLGARFRLTRSEPDVVRGNIRKRLDSRRRSQPLGVPSAGCWFRNPEGDSAGRLIDKAGMKGVRKGGASVSDVHANFFVNAGGASAEDFLALASHVRDSVKQRFGIWLEEEVKVIDG